MDEHNLVPRVLSLLLLEVKRVPWERGWDEHSVCVYKKTLQKTFTHAFEECGTDALRAAAFGQRPFRSVMKLLQAFQTFSFFVMIK